MYTDARRQRPKGKEFCILVSGYSKWIRIDRIKIKEASVFCTFFGGRFRHIFL